MNRFKVEKPSRYDSDVIEKWNLIKNESPKVNGVIGVDTLNLPPWIDRERYVNVSLPVFAKIRPSLVVSGLVGLSWLVQVPTILPPLLFTKKSENICALFSRYLDTVMHVRNWQNTDIFDPDTAGYKSLASVRSMHRHVGKVMNSAANDHSNPTKITPNVWVSQYDMVITQWAFYGLTIMCPKACGLYHITDDELYEVVYFWRVVSFFIGIDDRFSFWAENLDKTQQLCHLIFDEVYRPILDHQDRASHGSKMAADIFTSVSAVLGPFTAQVANKYWFEILEIKTEVVLETWFETFLYHLLKISYGTMLKLKPVHSILNWYIEYNFENKSKPEFKRHVADKLKENEKYTEIRYTFDDSVF